MPRPHAPARAALRLAIGCALAIVTGAGSCERDNVTPVPLPEPPAASERDNVDARLNVFFDRYEAEAERRGIVVDLSALQLTGHIRDIDGEGVAGECTYDPRAPNTLVIDAELWDDPNVGDELREYVVFHELGHCERLRGHREDRDPDNVCVSLMASGTGECRPVFNAGNREVILDELFNEEFYGDGF